MLTSKRFILVFIGIICAGCGISVRANYAPEAVTENPSEERSTEDQSEGKDDLDELMSEFDKTSHLLQSLPRDEFEKHLNDFISKLNELVRTPTNGHKFCQNKGVNKVITPYLFTQNVTLKRNLLKLVKTLFEVAPMTSSHYVPKEIVEHLVETIEFSNDIASKSFCIDILCAWLPGHPRIQARLMKYTGLEPFYHQMKDLDATGQYKLLDVFNKIIQEHLKVLKTEQRTKKELDNYKIYQRIGLVEQVSTPQICLGLLNIFVTSWTFNTEDNKLLIPTLDLMKTVESFCGKFYSNKKTAQNLFDSMKNDMLDVNKRGFYESLGIDVEEMGTLVEKYVQYSKPMSDKGEL